MTHSNLSVEVQGTHILVVLRGTCFRARYRKQEAPWLATAELGPDDPEAPITLSEFRSLAWAAANETARGRSIGRAAMSWAGIKPRRPHFAFSAG
jgi:hypothetical protein